MTVGVEVTRLTQGRASGRLAEPPEVGSYGWEGGRGGPVT